jgi:hypothetical protein
MKTAHGWIGLPLSLSLWAGAETVAPIVSVNRDVESPYQVTERGPYHRVWRREELATDVLGRARTNVHQYVELGTGMHYWADGQWQETQEVIQGYPDGAIARFGPHRVIFANNLNVAGAVDLQTPDDNRLRSHILGLSYFDVASGQSVLFAQLQDSLGGLLPPNQMLYTNAFCGVQADVRYTYRMSGFEQDVILREQPPSRTLWGLNPKTTRLQVLTEFLDPPTPRQRVVSVRSDPARVDAVLDFGAMRIRSGRAFVIGAAGEAGRSVRVTKQWLLLESRRFLGEKVPFAAVEPQLRTLPATAATASAKPLTDRGDSVIAALGGRLPRPGAARRAGAVELARLAAGRRAGVVLDYQILGGDSDFTFRGDTTYYCTNLVELDGTTVLEGGAVIKFFTNTSATIVCADELVCRTGPYRPAIFTAKDDDSAGETIAGSTGNPTGYYGGIGLDLAVLPYLTLSDLRFCYLNNALAGYGLTLRNTQLIQCKNGFGIVGEADVLVPRLYNVLIDRVNTFVPTESYGGDTVIAEHVTAHNCATFLADTTAAVYLTNCLFVGVTNWEGLNTYTNTSAFLNSDTGIFQTVGAGALYLTNNSPYRDVGTANINSDLLADLQHKTTHPPLLLTNKETTDVTLSPQAPRDTDTPDLGYHYDPIDYIASVYTITNATLTLSNGVAIANYNEPGIWLQDGSQLISVGSPTALNRIVRYLTVQEQPVKLGAWALDSAMPVFAYAYGDVHPTCDYRFTEFSTLAGGGYHFYSQYYANDSHWLITNAVLRDCLFHHGKVQFDATRIAVTNNLFGRANLSTGSGTEQLSFRNNLVRGGALTVLNSGTNAWVLRDNSFDSCSIFTWDLYDLSKLLKKSHGNLNTTS